MSVQFCENRLSGYHTELLGQNELLPVLYTFLTDVDVAGHREPHQTPFCNFLFTISAVKTRPLLNGVNEILCQFLCLWSDIDIQYTRWASSHFRTLMVLTQSSLKRRFALEPPAPLTVWKYCVGQENIHVS